MKKIICSILLFILFFVLFLGTTKVNAEATELNDEVVDLTSEDYILTDDLTLNKFYVVEAEKNVVIDLNKHTLTIPADHTSAFFTVYDKASLTFKNGTILFDESDSFTNSNLVALKEESTLNSEEVTFETVAKTYKELSGLYLIASYSLNCVNNVQKTNFTNCKFNGNITALQINQSYMSSEITTINYSATFKDCDFNTFGNAVIGLSLNELLLENCTISHNKNNEIDIEDTEENSFYEDSYQYKSSSEEYVVSNVTVKDVTVTDTYCLFGVFKKRNGYSIYTFEGNCNFGDTLVFDGQSDFSELGYYEPDESIDETYRVIVNDKRTNKTNYKVAAFNLNNCEEPEGDKNIKFIKTEKDNLQYIDYTKDYAAYYGATSTDNNYGYLNYNYRVLDGVDGKTVKTPFESAEGTTYSWYRKVAGEPNYITDFTGFSNPTAIRTDWTEESAPVYDETNKSWTTGAYSLSESNTDHFLYAFSKPENKILVVKVDVKGSDIKYLNDIGLINIETFESVKSHIVDSKGNYVEQTEDEEDVDNDETYTYTYYIVEDGNYAVYLDTERGVNFYNYTIDEYSLVENENTNTISFAEKGYEYISTVINSYYDTEYTLVSEIIIGTEVEKVEDKVEEKTSYTWVIIVGSVVAIIAAYVIVYFAAYAKGKLKQKFFVTIYSWFEKLIAKLLKK